MQDWASQERTQFQSGVWKVKMEGGHVYSVGHFIPNEGDRSDPSRDWVTFVRPSSLRSISSRPLRSIFDLASPFPSKHLWLNCYVGQISAGLSFGNSDAISRMWENWICIWIWTWLHDFAGRCKVDILISI
ncbi:hypothetical protein FEM48_Zijuj11G0080000 [Ziziphus jujuba var. spinosa]|uniref:Uncharacterized protein n=1 Tax=Ziziphus jujuba var. spinosa TaxID=714518 RepID=A0A978UHS0_ZIZJJ|nr:hypothetical protein FEM48_Zijuj11G0080000 [Ziziphus jujuba var. spinosa]